MSVERFLFRSALGVSLALLLLAGSAAAQEAPPDADFLEYLGAWEATDEDWMIVGAGMAEAQDEDEETGRPVRDADDEVTESTDES